MTDLQLLDKYCEECLDFISPVLLRDIESRGLYSYILRLPNNVAQAKAVIRGRLGKDGRYVGDPEIEEIADMVCRLESLRASLNRLNMADTDQTAPVLKEMQHLTDWLSNYYNK
ncbi:hypothetical protein [Spirosoma sordidisoli]|uniref:Uncharacterized protein n=1 Tax=Spirosoma sordidisoli TaxID=2502893 RepID=A0A4Q2UN23_9BACT|nr:hypothetical protein [Spirosoma sordidisoli]RYC70716.1 hypothetical protein EQG79_00760 [Spirosoma sordidisoli]